MGKYEVTLEVTCFLKLKLEADDHDDAALAAEVLATDCVAYYCADLPGRADARGLADANAELVSFDMDELTAVLIEEDNALLDKEGQ